MAQIIYLALKEAVVLTSLALVMGQYLQAWGQPRAIILAYYLGLAIGLVLTSLLSGILPPEVCLKGECLVVGGLLLSSGIVAWKYPGKELSGQLLGWCSRVASHTLFFLFGLVLILSSHEGIDDPMVSLLSLGMGVILLCLSKPLGLVKLARLFTLPEVLFIIFVVKLLANYSILLPFLQTRAIKLGHDLVHLLIVLFLLPDHPFLQPFWWQVIGLSFGKQTTLIILSTLLSIPALLLIRNIWRQPLPARLSTQSRAEWRKLYAEVRRKKRLRTLHIYLCLALILLGGYTASTQSGTLYEPSPEPVVDDGSGFITLDLSSPIAHLSEGKLHKYLYTQEDIVVTFLVIQRPDGRWATTLDICELCPPEGYAQLGKDLFCKYCKTPIPIGTIGEPGGCNPIPIPSQVDKTSLRISVKELLDKYRQRIKTDG